MTDFSGNSFRTRKRMRVLLLLSASALIISPALAGGTLPTSGQYVMGKGTVAKDGSKGLTINQWSASGIIDWKTFSIGKKNSVDFNNGSGATLNRVTGGNLSSIAGSLHATGSVYVINSAGVMVGKSGRIDTGGTFAASSGDTSDSSFVDGRKLRFRGAKGDVSNAGSISSKAGDVILIGRAVKNTGSLSAEHGTASLNAGNNVYLAPGGTTGNILVSGGHGSATNSGTINAAQAQINAAGGNVYALSGNNGGIIRATGTSNQNGHVWLTSNSGNVTVAGNISAENADGSGGRVTLRGANIANTGSIDASATRASKFGGDISITAKNTTNVGGTIKAEGGEHSSGGNIDTSGEHVHVADGARISTLSTNGQAGDWLIDPIDFIIAASGGDITGAALASELATTDVTIKNSQGAASGHGDIVVDDAVSWSSNHQLTLDAYRDIDFNANVSATGKSAHPVLEFGKDYVAGAGASVTLKGSSAALSVNGVAYTLIHTMAELQAIGANAAVLKGHYALAQSLNAANVTSWSPIGVDGKSGGLLSDYDGFSGVFAGLGHSISHLTIKTPKKSYVGLFGISEGTIRDVAVTTGNISGRFYVGSLVGYNNNGTISGAWSSDVVTGSANGQYIGGLIGVNHDGTVSNSYATGAVKGTFSVGGFAGENDESGTLDNVYATGAITVTALPGYTSCSDCISSNGGYAGGLVGHNEGTIKDASASGKITDKNDGSLDVGGLVGQNWGTIDSSHSASVVSAASESIGGLVGANEGGTISHSYASGAVSSTNKFGYAGGLAGYSSGEISKSYATGNVSDDSAKGNYIGGLVGQNDGGGIGGSYALGAVTSGSHSLYIGGLAGDNAEGTIANAYATGKVTGGTLIGGLVGSNDSAVNQDTGKANIGTITNSHASGAVVSKGGDNSEAAGFAGENDGGVITGSYATGAVTSGGFYVGGFVGDNTLDFNGDAGVISKSYATGAVTAKNSDYVGGFAGFNDAGVTIEGVYATGAVVDSASNGSDVGGLVGLNAGTIHNAYATGAVKGVGTVFYVGGLIGGNGGAISDAYFIGAVSTSYGGGSMGNNNGTITHVYWDTDTATQSIGIGYANNSQTVTARSTSQLQGKLPTGFSSSSWATGKNLFPYLKWQVPKAAARVLAVFTAMYASPLWSEQPGNARRAKRLASYR